MSRRLFAGSLPLLLVAVAVLAVSPASAENRSLLFDGVDDYVTVPEAVDLTGPLTVEAWVKVDADPSGGRIVSNRQGSNGYEMDVVENGGDYNLRFTFNGSLVIDAPFNAYVGVWTHVAASWQGPPSGTVSIYINGVTQDSYSFGQTINNSPGPLRIGAMGPGAFHYRGQMDDVRIWSAYLDEATIAAWMGQEPTAAHPNFANLEAYWNFDEGAGQIAENKTGDARRDGELGSSSGDDTNDPQWQSDGAPVPTERSSIGRVKQRFVRR